MTTLTMSRRVRKHLFTQPHPTVLPEASSLNDVVHIVKSMGAYFGFIYHFSNISLGIATDDSDELAKLFKIYSFCKYLHQTQCILTQKTQVTAKTNYTNLEVPLFWNISIIPETSNYKDVSITWFDYRVKCYCWFQTNQLFLTSAIVLPENHSGHRILSF